MLPTPWVLLSWIKAYKWLFILFTCQCVPSRVALANRLTHRTRILEDDLYRGNLDKSPSHSSPNHYINSFSPSSSSSSVNHFDNQPSFYRSIDHSGYPNQYSSPPVNPVMPVDHEPSESSSSSSLSDNRFERNLSGFRLFKQAYAHRSDDGTASHESLVCSTPDARNGMCYDAAECTERGGIPMGRCSGGSGGSVCCLFEATCGDSVQEKHAYFRNPGYPVAFEQPQLCRLKVNKPTVKAAAAPICQLRLKFTEFDIAKPVEGNCTQDIFSVSGQNENNIIPRICGYNSGQHYYIAVDESGLVNLQLVLRGNYHRKFDIHIEQIECGSKDLAPPYCLQYYDSTQGTIKSFNYDTRNLPIDERDMSSPSSNAVYEGYPNNIDYLICIRKETGFCSVSYEFMSDQAGTVLPFSVGLSGGTASGRRGSQSRVVSGTILNNGFANFDVRNQFVPITVGSGSIQSNDCEDDFLIIGGLRVCSKTNAANDAEDEHVIDHVTLNPGTSTISSSTTVTTSDGPRNNETTVPNRNGELHETMDEVIPEGPAQSTDAIDETLRRAHRRANYHYRNSDWYVPQSSSRGSHQTKRNTPTSNLMATDWTPGPFQMRFVSNGVNNARGFYLAYRQNPCRI